MRTLIDDVDAIRRGEIVAEDEPEDIQEEEVEDDTGAPPPTKGTEYYRRRWYPDRR